MVENLHGIIEKQIVPHLDVNMENITNKVKEKYGQALKKNEEQIEVVE